MKVGDRVRASPMWKYDSADGVILKINKEYTVVRWNDIGGDWHYTKEQTKKLEVINESR